MVACAGRHGAAADGVVAAGRRRRRAAADGAPNVGGEGWASNSREGADGGGGGAGVEAIGVRGDGGNRCVAAAEADIGAGASAGGLVAGRSPT